MVAWHDNATLDKGPGGDIGGHVTSMPFPPLVDALQLPGPRRLSPTRDHTDAVDYTGLLVISKHNPPSHLVATMPRHKSHTTHSSGTGQHFFGHKDVGADMLRHVLAAARA